MLTDKAVRAAPAKHKRHKVTDRSGHHSYVSPKAYKSWRFKTRSGKKEQLIALGSWTRVIASCWGHTCSVR
jgi:hypothetical protein